MKPPIRVAVDVTLKGGTCLPVAELLVSLEIPLAFMTGCEPDDLPDRLRNVPLLRKPFGLDGLLTTIKTLFNDDPTPTSELRRTGRMTAPAV